MVSVKATKDGRGVLTLKSRLDREVIDQFEVALQCLKAVSLSGAKWESYNPNVRDLSFYWRALV
jgi:hypothetical protein